MYSGKQSKADLLRKTMKAKHMHSQLSAAQAPMSNMQQPVDTLKAKKRMPANGMGY